MELILLRLTLFVKQISGSAFVESSSPSCSPCQHFYSLPTTKTSDVALMSEVRKASCPRR